MKTKMLSISIGSSACYAKCPFCVSGEDICQENMNLEKIPSKVWAKFGSAVRLAKTYGVDTIMLTSLGETTLYPDEITAYLEYMNNSRFPFVELQTNGVLLATGGEKYYKLLKHWFELGLTTIAISMVSTKYEDNAKIYSKSESSYFEIKTLTEKLHDIGYSVRYTCILCNGFISSVEDVDNFIKFAKNNEADQVTLRPVNDEYRREDAHNWIKEHKLTEKQREEIRSYLNDSGTALLEIPRIGTVYDMFGQNVMYSVPLTKFTRDTTPENIRQLIFTRDGHIRYEWEMGGGILL